MIRNTIAILVLLGLAACASPGPGPGNDCPRQGGIGGTGECSNAQVLS